MPSDIAGAIRRKLGRAPAGTREIRDRFVIPAGRTVSGRHTANDVSRDVSPEHVRLASPIEDQQGRSITGVVCRGRISFQRTVTI